MHTKEAALADPVIGKYVKRVLDRDRTGALLHGSLIQKFGPALADEILVLYRTNCPELVGRGDLDCNSAAGTRAIRYMTAYPDTVHMMDLSAEELLAMTKMGCVPAAIYLPIVAE